MTELAWIRGSCPWCSTQLEAVEVLRPSPFGPAWSAFELLQDSFDHLADAHGADVVGSS